MGPNISQTVIDAQDEHERGERIESWVRDPNPRYSTRDPAFFTIEGKYPAFTRVKLYECKRCGTVFAVKDTP
jgi:hypothetical protein